MNYDIAAQPARAVHCRKLTTCATGNPAAHKTLGRRVQCRTKFFREITWHKQITGYLLRGCLADIFGGPPSGGHELRSPTGEKVPPIAARKE